MTKGLVESFRAGGVPSVPAAPAAPVAAEPALDPEAYLTGAQAMAFADRIVARIQAQPPVGSDQAASAVYGMASLRHPKEFARYEPEIQQLLSSIPKTSWTLDTMDKVVTLIKGQHMTDYRSEWEQEYVAKLEPSMRSIGAAGTVSAPSLDKQQSLESDKIPPDWKLRAQKAGITEATVVEFCRANDMTAAEFFKLFESGKVVTEGAVA